MTDTICDAIKGLPDNLRFAVMQNDTLVAVPAGTTDGLKALVAENESLKEQVDMLNNTSYDTEIWFSDEHAIIKYDDGKWRTNGSYEWVGNNKRFIQDGWDSAIDAYKSLADGGNDD